jgi:hypothetical protein
MAVTLDPTASSPTATNVIVVPERVGGRVTNVSGSTLTVTNRHGTETVTVTPDTKYLEKDATPAGVSDGELITAFGLPDPSTPGDVDAKVITIFSPPPQPQPGGPDTAPVNQSPYSGPPQGLPGARQVGGGPGTAAWGRPTPNVASSPHGPSGWLGSPGGFGGQDFGGR